MAEHKGTMSSAGTLWLRTVVVMISPANSATKGKVFRTVCVCSVSLALIAFVLGSGIGVALALEAALLCLPQFRRAIGGRYPRREKVLVVASASSCAVAGGAYCGHLWLVTWVFMNLALIFLGAIVVQRGRQDQAGSAVGRWQ